MISNEPNYDRWPWLLREVAQELGPDAALKLVSRYGGQLISVPRFCAGSTIEAELGSEIAVLLVNLRGGENIEVPNFAQRLAEERRRFILTHPDLSANDCARRLGITHTRVRQVRREARTDPAQLDLFQA